MNIILSGVADTFNIISSVIYILGLLFLLIEFCIPGFGFFGISGFSMVGVGIIIKVILGDNLLSIILILLIALLVSIAFLILFIIRAKNGKSILVSSGSSIPTFYNDDDLKVFIGASGETVTSCKPIGKIRIENEIYEARSVSGYLQIGTKIKVINVKDNALEIEVEKETNIVEKEKKDEH